MPTISDGLFSIMVGLLVFREFSWVTYVKMYGIRNLWKKREEDYDHWKKIQRMLNK
jgi:hypothetical protein